MTFSRSVPLLLFWKLLYPNTSHEIPSQQMIDEAIIPPVLNSEFALNIISKYEIEDKKELLSIITKNNPDTFWGDITNELSDVVKYNPKLYAFFSLQKYRQTCEYFSRSYDVFRNYSNSTAYFIERIAEDPLLKEICYEIGINCQNTLYAKRVSSYCKNVLPFPLRYIRNVDLDYQTRPIVEGKFREAIKSTKDIPFPEGKLGEYLNRIEESDRRVEIRFSEYHLSRQFLQNLDYSFPQQLEKYHSSRFNLNSANVTHRKNQTRKQKKQEESLIIIPKRENTALHQCQFCYGYILDKTKNVASWHCGQNTCKTAYGSWKKDLLRKTCQLDKLSKLGF